ncbi:TatD family hydrolase [Flavobacterium sp. FlaQc-28]|uniref:TatD family hydrolase n=1 Tax=Flavobacterium sp. FlaQc-28 TaxID=3374178 RepID=UPI00375754B1
MDFFNFHTHQFTNQSDILELVNQYPQEFDASIPYYSIGIHPWYIKEDRLENDLRIIEEKLQTKNCLALGECGLDKRVEIPLELQIQVFEKQLILAEKYQKPVVIHCVAAFQEIIAIKKKMKISVPMIVHGFSKNNQVAEQLITAGFYISFGKYLFQNPSLKEVFLNIPNDRFFLETDTIEEGIQQVYDLAAIYKNSTLRELKEIIERNYKEVFEK